MLREQRNRKLQNGTKQASSAQGPIVVNDDSCGVHSRPYHNY